MNDSLRHLETDMAIIKETMATSSELHQALNAQTWKMITALIASMAVMTGIFSAIVKFS